MPKACYLLVWFFILALSQIANPAAQANSQQSLQLAGFVAPSTSVRVTQSAQDRSLASLTPSEQGMLELATLATTSNTASALELGLTTKTGERPELRINGIARNLILPTSTTERYRVTTPVSNNQQTLFLSVTAL